MTGWDLLEELSGLVDNEPEKLNAEIYTEYIIGEQLMIAFNIEKIKYKKIPKSEIGYLSLIKKGDK